MVLQATRPLHEHLIVDLIMSWWKSVESLTQIETVIGSDSGSIEIHALLRAKF